jgi:hypothetical protein
MTGTEEMIMTRFAVSLLGVLVGLAATAAPAPEPWTTGWHAEDEGDCRQAGHRG